MSFRIGLGKDSHRFSNEKSDKCLIIGGVEFPGLPSFVAHSDGDVLFHAVFNAISSGLGLHSIGHYFPNASVEEAGRNSHEYLIYVKTLCANAGYKIVNISITVECKFPAIDPVSTRMCTKLAEALSLDQSQIGITATSGEQTSPWGQGLGVEVTAIVLLEKV